MYKKFLITSVLICCSVLATFAIVSTLDGKWVGKVLLNGSEMPVSFNFKVDGDKLTGTSETSYGVATIDNGKITGNEFSFTTTVSSYEIPHSGKFYPDSVSLNVDVMGSTLHTTLTRAK